MMHWFFYYGFAMLAIACAAWHFRVVRANRQTKRDGQWVYIITAKAFLTTWGILGMLTAPDHGFWFNLSIPLFATFTIDFVVKGVLRYLYLPRSRKYVQRPVVQTQEDTTELIAQPTS